MLNYFRHHSLRNSLWLMVLLGSILTQTQNLYACELMDGGPQTTCCCDEDMSKGCHMGGGCDIPESGVATGCCDISTDISVGLADVTVFDSHHAKQLLTLDTSQPPPTVILRTNFTIFSSDVFDTFLVYDSALSEQPLLGRHAYFTTKRFRI